MQNQPDRSVTLTSAKQMRALAHPLRLRILGELRVGGPRSVGGLSEVFDEAPGTLSYHLGKLAEFGFVEEAPELAADRRERWWRSAHELTRIDAAAPDASVAERQAASAIRHQVIDVSSAILHKAVDDAEALPREWVEAAVSSDTVAFLTAAELAEVGTELEAVLAKWRARSNRDRDDAAAVQLIAHAVRRP